MHCMEKYIIESLSAGSKGYYLLIIQSYDVDNHYNDYFYSTFQNEGYYILAIDQTQGESCTGLCG